MAFFESVKCATQSPRAQSEVRLLKKTPKTLFAMINDRAKRQLAFKKEQMFDIHA